MPDNSDTTEPVKAKPSDIRAYFREPGVTGLVGDPVGLPELKAFMQADKAGYDQVAIGIGNGTLTY